MKGKIYIASMNLRGKWATPIDFDSIKVNVTSAQAKLSKNRLDFSPMTPMECGYKGYWNFEHYWQSGKVFENIPIEKTKKWWKSLEQPKRRYPNSKNKKVLYSIFDGNDEKMDYITSRKKIYIPEYYNLIQNKDMLKHWKEKYNSGKSITIYDFDGPRLENGEVTCLKLNKKLIKEKLNDPKFSFGHGYIVASAISDINILDLC